MSGESEENGQENVGEKQSSEEFGKEKEKMDEGEVGDGGEGEVAHGGQGSQEKTGEADKTSSGPGVEQQSLEQQFIGPSNAEVPADTPSVEGLGSSNAGESEKVTIVSVDKKLAGKLEPPPQQFFKQTEEVATCLQVLISRRDTEGWVPAQCGDHVVLFDLHGLYVQTDGEYDGGKIYRGQISAVAKFRGEQLFLLNLPLTAAVKKHSQKWYYEGQVVKDFKEKEFPRDRENKATVGIRQMLEHSSVLVCKVRKKGSGETLNIITADKLSKGVLVGKRDDVGKWDLDTFQWLTCNDIFNFLDRAGQWVVQIGTPSNEARENMRRTLSLESKRKDHRVKKNLFPGVRKETASTSLKRRKVAKDKDDEGSTIDDVVELVRQAPYGFPSPTTAKVFLQEVATSITVITKAGDLERNYAEEEADKFKDYTVRMALPQSRESSPFTEFVAEPPLSAQSTVADAELFRQELAKDRVAQCVLSAISYWEGKNVKARSADAREVNAKLTAMKAELENVKKDTRAIRAELDLWRPTNTFREEDFPQFPSDRAIHESVLRRKVREAQEFVRVVGKPTLRPPAIQPPAAETVVPLSDAWPTPTVPGLLSAGLDNIVPQDGFFTGGQKVDAIVESMKFKDRDNWKTYTVVECVEFFYSHVESAVDDFMEPSDQLTENILLSSAILADDALEPNSSLFSGLVPTSTPLPPMSNDGREEELAYLTPLVEESPSIRQIMRKNLRVPGAALFLQINEGGGGDGAGAAGNPPAPQHDSQASMPTLTSGTAPWDGSLAEDEELGIIIERPVREVNMSGGTIWNYVTSDKKRRSLLIYDTVPEISRKLRDVALRRAKNKQKSLWAKQQKKSDKGQQQNPDSATESDLKEQIFKRMELYMRALLRNFFKGCYGKVFLLGTDGKVVTDIAVKFKEVSGLRGFDLGTILAKTDWPEPIRSIIVFTYSDFELGTKFKTASQAEELVVRLAAVFSAINRSRKHYHTAKRDSDDSDV